MGELHSFQNWEEMVGKTNSFHSSIHYSEHKILSKTFCTFFSAIYDVLGGEKNEELERGHVVHFEPRALTL